jgi:biopolymer transport protein TolR
MAGMVPESELGDDDANFLPLAEINVTPLVDVMLVLLIIFMVAAPLMIAGVPVNLPKSAAAKQNPPQKPMVVTITPEGELYLREEKVERDALPRRLGEVRSAEGDAVAYVRADTSIRYGDVMAVLGEVGAAGYTRISLLSQPLTGKPTAAIPSSDGRSSSEGRK